jgi:hypothetical protein
MLMANSTFFYLYVLYKDPVSQRVYIIKEQHQFTTCPVTTANTYD